MPLEEARRTLGLPTSIRVDRGTQFTSKELDLWAYGRGMVLDFFRPGTPTDNAYAESFNAIVRMESSANTGSWTSTTPAKRWKRGAVTATK